MKITIFDYGFGNVRSSQRAFEAAFSSESSGELSASKLGVFSGEFSGESYCTKPAESSGEFSGTKPDVQITNSLDFVRESQIVVIPGVGNFGACVDGFRSSGGLEMLKICEEQNIKVFGICVGMQILFDSSTESGGSTGLGVFHGDFTKIEADVVPHMGWNSLNQGCTSENNSDDCCSEKLGADNQGCTSEKNTSSVDSCCSEKNSDGCCSEKLGADNQGCTSEKKSDGECSEKLGSFEQGRTSENDNFYFVHSYALKFLKNPELTDQFGSYTITKIGDYEFISSVTSKDGRIVATQFHPEKSGQSGLSFIKNA
jgi:imidazoleglycerol phosphate synthase glutamine amidotransferase subunit HisH